MSLLHRTHPKAPEEAPPATEPESTAVAEVPVTTPAETPVATETTTGQLVVRFELPGLDPDKDVEVTVSDGMLRIDAEREETTEDDGTSRSFRFSYARTMTLPAGAADGVTATYRDGVLEVHVPIPETQVESKRIPITT